MCIDLVKARTCCSHVSNAWGLACDPTTTPEQMASFLEYHGKMWYNFVVPNSAIPNFASAKTFPLWYYAFSLHRVVCEKHSSSNALN